MKSKGYYFLKGFIPVTILIFVFNFVKGIWGKSFSEIDFMILIPVCLYMGILTGALLGAINIFLKRENIFLFKNEK